MPIYLFVCEKCEHQFELFVRKMDIGVAACPECGGEATRGIERPSPFVWGRGGAYNG
jgi:putative FmdB family regulatory protein